MDLAQWRVQRLIMDMDAVDAWSLVLPLSQDRLHVQDTITILLFPDLVRQAATTALLPGNVPRLRSISLKCLIGLPCLWISEQRWFVGASSSFRHPQRPSV